MEPIIYSFAFYLIVLIFCELSRQAIDQFTDGPNSLTRKLGYEIIGTLQVVTCVYENGVVVKNYGVPGFFIAVLILLYIHIGINRNAIVNPLAALENLLFGRTDISTFAMLTACQLIGGFLAYRVAKSVWWLHLMADHAHNYKAFTCVIKHKISYPLVALYEVIGCFLIRFAVGSVKPENKRYAAASITATLLSFALYTSGVPGLNPIVAIGRLYGCPGLSPFWFFTTYWLLNAVGWIAAAYYLDRRQKKLV